MTQSFTLSIQINSVQWVRSLRVGEEDWSRKIVEAVEAECKRHKMPFVLHDVHSATEFEDLLKKLASDAAAGLRPLIHIDMHGGKDEGLEIAPASVCVPWSSIADLLAAINVAADHNLCVVSAACEGLHVISEVAVTEPCPFTILLAPEDPILMDFLELKTFPFYQELLSSGDIVAAHKAHLSPELTLFNAEKQFARALTRYIREHCIGAGADTRVDELIAEAKKLASLSPADEVNARVIARKGIEPSAELIDRFAPTFLGRTPTFNFDDVMKAAGVTPTP